MAFETAQRAFLGLALGFFAREVGLGSGVVAARVIAITGSARFELAVFTAVKAQLVALT